MFISLPSHSLIRSGRFRNTAEHQDPKIYSDSEKGPVMAKQKYQRGNNCKDDSSCTRSEYFKTALSTAVGNQEKVIEVEECSPQVLDSV